MVSIRLVIFATLWVGLRISLASAPTSDLLAAFSCRLRGQLLADAVGGEHHVSCFLADHRSRRLRIAADQRRHDRGVGHAEPLDAAHSKLRVYDRVSIGPH